MNFFRTFLIIATVSLSSVANAGLTITFDTNAETFSFSGSQAITIGTYSWGSVPFTGDLFFIGDTEITNSGGDGVEINDASLGIQISGGTVTLMGSGATVSYAGISGTRKAYIGTLDGSNLASNDALDAISITVVPEPSQYAALFGAGLLGLGFLRRRSVGCSAIR